ncbi:hypothetical protein C7S18_06560 [Ahniella affigens]|uniref:GtrA/DPMS transmembrane domain-containing protein n=1 Tax=Ahniella affigens TaxID=2021234 RepID=A0A2P1PPW2_9GAMM|nr:GtrA family protein [Ahniella affigens]AVP96881.1 hypothetical protein C7S18_06560 [Ahniella affigens]
MDALQKRWQRVPFREVLTYLLIGGTQFVLDWALFSLLHWLGMPASPANLLGRATAALLGFYLNGRFTFAEPGGQKLGGARFGRFVLAWILMTVLSTVLVQAVVWLWPGPMVYLAKPAIEILLAFLNFFVLKWFVYR